MDLATAYGVKHAWLADDDDAFLPVPPAEREAFDLEFVGFSEAREFAVLQGDPYRRERGPPSQDTAPSSQRLSRT